MPIFLRDDLQKFADSVGIEYVGLQRPFTLYYEQCGGRLHWGHWNYAGHRVVADVLSRKLEAVYTPEGESVQEVRVPPRE